MKKLTSLEIVTIGTIRIAPIPVFDVSETSRTYVSRLTVHHIDMQNGKMAFFSVLPNSTHRLQFV